MKKTTIKNYAKLVACVGGNVQKGQEVYINAQLDQPEFISYLVDECYRAGAKKVIVNWEYQPVTKSDIRYRSLSVLSKFDEWEIERLRHRSAVLPVLFWIESEDPDGLRGINQAKFSKAQQARYKITKPFRDEIENKYQWCIAAVPGKAWAKKVFPELKVNQAMEKLWEAILFTSRADGEDPVKAWEEHNKDLLSRCEYLNSLGIDKLHYTASNGTDFTVGMIDDALFLGGGETSLGKGIYYNPNIPSEEVFISPKKGEADGIVYSSKPLSYRGELIEGFSVRFENGKAVEVHAEKNEALLNEIINMDEGSAYLGECALVPVDSPISESGITFHNTLFDENAACHLALGFGFTNCIKDYANYTIEQCREKGINDSGVHVDFMIGTADLSIDAITKDGRTVPVFRDGKWAFSAD